MGGGVVCGWASVKVVAAVGSDGSVAAHMLTCLHTINLHFCNLLPPLPHSSRQSLKLHDPLLTRHLLAAGAAPGGGPGRPLIEELLEEWGLLSHMVSLQQVRRGCADKLGRHMCCHTRLSWL